MKSLVAETTSVLELSVGSAEIYSLSSESKLHGHDLLKLYRKLPLRVRKQFGKECDIRCKNEIGLSLIRLLSTCRLVFPTGRYAFESRNRNARFNLGLGGAGEVMKLATIMRESLLPYLDDDGASTSFGSSVHA